MIYKTQHRKQNVEQHEPHKKMGVNAVAPGRFIISFNIIYLLLSKIINSDSPQFHLNQMNGQLPIPLAYSSRLTLLNTKRPRHIPIQIQILTCYRQNNVLGL